MRTAIVFTTLIFTSAALVFSVQPLVGRMLLPTLGGTAVVWNTCLVFFQGALLLGYLYAHTLTQRFSLRTQIGVHLAALAVAAVVLPIDFAASTPGTNAVPTIWLLGALMAAVGPPFIAISASAPLFQSWFARTTHDDASDPYFLYAASNVGSMLALIAYPFLIEPNLTLKSQSFGWAIGYAAVLLLAAGAGYLTWRESAETGLRARFLSDPSSDTPAITGRQLARWVGLAFVPSALLVAVTAHITTDIAPIPLLWMVPLVVYLLTYVAAFAKRQFLSIHWMVALSVPLLLMTALLTSTETRWLFSKWAIALHVAAFGAAALAFHMLLARERPPVANLTAYFLAMSLGGVLGGAFVALLAPLLFDSMVEYPALLVLATVAVVLMPEYDGSRRRIFVVGSSLAFLLVGATLWYVYDYHGSAMSLRAIGVLFVTLLAYLLHRRPRLFFAGAIALVFVHGVLAGLSREPLFEKRSYFGHMSVADYGNQRVLRHGRVVHGVEIRSGPNQGQPTGYYHPTTGVARAFEAMHAQRTPLDVAIIGLGVGGLAYFAHPDSQITFYEIDPLVVDIASNPELFTYLDRCGERCKVEIGDARIQLEHADNASFDLIVEDAFNSDAVPVHLLTREAMQLYVDKLKPDGLLVFHISNRHLNLAAVVDRLARDADLEILLNLTQTPDGTTSLWAAVARDESVFGSFAEAPGTLHKWSVPAGATVWTDDYADVLSVYLY